MAASEARPRAGQAPARGFQSLVRLKPDSGRRTLFCVHPSGGSVAWYVPMAAELDADQPLIAFQPVGVAGRQLREAGQSGTPVWVPRI